MRHLKLSLTVVRLTGGETFFAGHKASVSGRSQMKVEMWKRLLRAALD
jgi:hypothetical protein